MDLESGYSSGNRQKFRDDEDHTLDNNLYSSLLHICPRSEDTPDGGIYIRIMRTEGGGMNYLVPTI